MRTGKWDQAGKIAGWLLVALGVGLQLYSLAVTISDNPLSTYWSETGRIFEASQVYAPLLYGRTMPWPWLDPGRAILDGLVLLIPGGSIWMFRFWLAFLSLATTALASFLVIRLTWKRSFAGQPPAGRGMFVILALWGTLFLFQGPIYYHVLLGVIPVLWFFDRDKPTHTLAAVVLASAWEGLCRVNWFWLPSALAILLYLLAVPLSGRKLRRYLAWPAAWGIAGTVASLGVYVLFINAFHYIIPFYDPNMHYGFFRFKLWPNAAYSLGLIPGIVLISLPLVVVALVAGLRKLRQVHWLRWLLIGAILGVFFIGSTIVSLRAGGGSDLHNYDTFLLLLFVVGCFLGMEAVAVEAPVVKPPQPQFHRVYVLLALAVIPIFMLCWNLPNRVVYSMSADQAGIQRVSVFLQAADRSHGPILNITNRQLEVYKMIPDQDMFVPYNQIELMEMAMANNKPYLNRFFDDLQSHRFSFIITNPLVENRQGINHAYGYENDVWAGYIVYPILKFYQPVLTDEASGLVIYAPK